MIPLPFSTKPEMMPDDIDPKRSPGFFPRTGRKGI
jgi:hypothetical protein